MGTAIDRRMFDAGVSERLRSDDASYAVDGAVALISALSQIDGLVVIGPSLGVDSFGTEISVMGLIRFCGHQPRGRYGVQDGTFEEAAEAVA